MKYFIKVFIYLSVTYNCEGQKQANNWYFGDKAGINFSSGIPVNLTGSTMNQYEGVASISDENGNLLFYTNGVNVWNKLHNIMLNGAGLSGHQSATQSAIIVPQPGNDSIYYVFTCDYQGHSNGLCYSVINIKKDNGLGEVILKNAFLLQPVTEKLTAVLHCNNRDVWVISRAWNSASYYAWLVTPSGISTMPVISTTNNYVSGHEFGTIGYMKASPDGKKIGATFQYPLSFTEVSSFNSQTGVISNTIKIPALLPGTFNPAPTSQVLSAYGLEFSPNSNLLYLSSRDIMEWNSPFRNYELFAIYQFDVSIHDSLQIIQSRKIIDSSSSLNFHHSALQTGPDNKIYIAEEASLFLSSIELPDNAGTACNYKPKSIPLTNRSWLGLPPFIQSYFGNNIYNYSYTNNCISQQVAFQISNTQGYSTIKWDFGDPSSGINNNSILPSPTHLFSAAGIYDVKLIVQRNNNPCAIPDTIRKSIWAGNVQTLLGNDTTICEKDTIVLQANGPNGVSYLWNNNSISSSVRITNPGDYWVKITAGACIYSDTIKILQQLLPRFTLGSDTSICVNANIILKPIPLIPNGTYLWNTNATNNTLTTNIPGSYWLKAKDNIGCAWIDTIIINDKQLPNFTLGRDTSICEQQTLTLNTQIPNASYFWSTGSTSQSIVISTAAIYWADVTKNGCTYRDSIELKVKLLPVVNLGKDSILCEGQSLLLTAYNPGAIYLWQNNTSLSSLDVNKAGEYFVRVDLNGCIESDTIKIDYNLKPRFSLGEDKMICPGETIVLQAIPNNINGISYLWQNGGTLSSISVNQAGLYILHVTNNCGTATDSILLREGTCKVIIPNAFTPNGDRVNDFFTILNTENITEFNLQIFDRWGNRIFETKDKLKGWDGKYNGIDVPIGLFIYNLFYKEKTSSSQFYRRGNIQVIR